MNIKWMMSAMLGLGLVLPALADETEKNGLPKEGVVRTEPAPKPQPKKNDADRKADELATHYKVSERQVKDLRAQGLGWGEISHALSIAQKAGVPVSDVMKLRDSGMGWGKIAQSYGFKLGHVDGKKPEMKREERKELREDSDHLRESHERGHQGGGQHGDRATHGRGEAKG